MWCVYIGIWIGTWTMYMSRHLVFTVIVFFLKSFSPPQGSSRVFGFSSPNAAKATPRVGAFLPARDVPAGMWYDDMWSFPGEYIWKSVKLAHGDEFTDIEWDDIVWCYIYIYINKYRWCFHIEHCLILLTMRPSISSTGRNWHEKSSEVKWTNWYLRYLQYPLRQHLGSFSRDILNYKSI